MPNNAVRAAAEGMPMNRRTMIAGAAATTIAGPALAVTPSTELADLIAAHKAAYKRFSQIVEVEEERTAAYFDAHDTEILIPLSVGGAQSLHNRHNLEDAVDDCRQVIKQRYKVLMNQCGPLAKVDADLAEKARRTLAKGKARDLARLRAAYRKETTRREAAGYAQFQREYDEASEADFAALDDVLAFKATTPADLNAKGQYLMSRFGYRFGSMNEFEVDSLLRSMLSDSEA